MKVLLGTAEGDPAGGRRALLAAIVESSNDAIIGTDLEDRIVSWNAAAERLLGHRAEEVVGASMRLLVPAGRSDEEARMLERLRRGEPIDHFETAWRRKDGARIDVSLTVSPIRDHTGTVVGASRILRDITELKRVQQALVLAKEAAEAANRELESFSYSVAHDLRAPLRSIDGFSQALLEDYGDKLDEKGRKYLRFLGESAQQMAQLIDDLLALSRVTRGELQCQEVDLSAMARSTLARLLSAEPHREVQVEVEEGLSAWADPRLVAVALDNLLGNAWKFTRRREHARIELGSTVANGEPVFFVRDNGAGFDMAFVGKLFTVFQRLHSGAEFEGTGVGLATVQRIVRRHGGRVWAEGEVEGGATFYFTLPEKEGTGW